MIIILYYNTVQDSWCPRFLIQEYPSNKNVVLFLQKKNKSNLLYIIVEDRRLVILTIYACSEGWNVKFVGENDQVFAP